MAQKATPKKATKKTSVKKGGASGRTARKAERPRKAVAKPRSETKPARKIAVPAAPAKAAAVPAKELRKEKVAPLSKQELQYFRNLLLERRREIIGDVGSMESEAFKGGSGGSNLSNMPIHMADVGTDNFEQEFTLGLIESERQILREIQEALVRIDNGTYGICQGTGRIIPRVRLEAVPWAKYTIEYSRLLESGQVDREARLADEDAPSAGDDDED